MASISSRVGVGRGSSETPQRRRRADKCTANGACQQIHGDIEDRFPKHYVGNAGYSPADRTRHAARDSARYDAARTLSGPIAHEPEASNGNQTPRGGAPGESTTLPTPDPDEPVAVYCHQQGTSMTTAHVSGVAALVLSRRIQGFQFGPDAGQVDAVRSLLSLSADPTACPASDVLAQYAPFPSLNNDAPQTCQGTPTFNGWYGAGLVNALSAVGLAVPD